MIPHSFHQPNGFDDLRILVVDDSDEDVTQLLTIACESFGSRTLRTSGDGGDQ